MNLTSKKRSLRQNSNIFIQFYKYEKFTRILFFFRIFCYRSGQIQYECDMFFALQFCLDTKTPYKNVCSCSDLFAVFVVTIIQQSSNLWKWYKFKFIFKLLMSFFLSDVSQETNKLKGKFKHLSDNFHIFLICINFSSKHAYILYYKIIKKLAYIFNFQFQHLLQIRFIFEKPSTTIISTPSVRLSLLQRLLAPSPAHNKLKVLSM